ncbi:hypothetical protein [Suttonella ornithocola]|uniref:Uncharacterized protein n=1 Tax=Suttonella ornithocola TaxID=279832 RepID=A0A380MP37_9GAMM|nr:hypothetical protein [Suttonella ornithocola]SUO93944.1 Uncharacterised protein [Suttonella ornithocola]
MDDKPENYAVLFIAFILIGPPLGALVMPLFMRTNWQIIFKGTHLPIIGLYGYISAILTGLTIWWLQLYRGVYGTFISILLGCFISVGLYFLMG